MGNENFKIEFVGEPFSEDKKNTQRSNFGDDVVNYSKEIQFMNPLVEELDKYDDFSALKIDLNKYAKTSESGEYGIEYDAAIHERGVVIKEHQKKAAENFLKVLRGFGLLADVVGSGKTFEAGVVLSELAVRGVIKNMLIIVPEQVYDSWVDVIENKFGLGKGQLFKVGDDINKLFVNREDFEVINLNGKDIFRPKKAIIVTFEDFVKWKKGPYQNDVLFDVIVVDEAHHLCEENGNGAKALYLLSSMMKLKKSFGTTYCLLLSATPHSGNLANMFRLWYFIRCKGGNPDDFLKESDDERSDEYVKEHNYYLNFICHRATTVMEFIKKVKIDLCQSDSRFSGEFKEYLKSKDVDFEKFTAMTDGEKWVYVDDFVEIGFERKKAISKSVANAYHNGVLRSIMIRQANRRNVSKKIINYYFAPSSSPKNQIATEGLAFDDVNVYFRNDGEIAVVSDKAYTLGGYASKFRPVNKNVPAATAQMLFDKRIFAGQAVTEDNFTWNGIERRGAIKYYWSQFENSPVSAENKFIFCDYKNRETFEYKIEVLQKILKDNANERVIVFFDYENDKQECDLVFSRLNEFFDRIIIGEAAFKDRVIDEFNRRKNAVLLVKDVCYTEGANLQECNIIVNFSVTADPLAMSQRIGRVYRLGQKNDVKIFSLADMRELEGYSLAYFTRIGLMTSDSSDATIIAGSNNEKMVAVRCPVPNCGNVRLFSLEDYENYKKTDSPKLYCDATEACREDNQGRKIDGTKMEEISVTDFKCENCNSTFIRTDKGYECVSVSKIGKGIMGNDSKNRDVYCTKRCAMLHCFRLEDKKCPVRAEILENKNVSDSDLVMICLNCSNDCPDKCRFLVYDNPSEAIENCSNCVHAMCEPKPHVLRFDKNWEAECPKCGEKLKPIHSRTFATYVKELWNFRHDKYVFCDNMSKEAKNVANIQKILENDMEE